MTPADISTGTGIDIYRVALVMAEKEKNPNGLRVSRWSHSKAHRWRVERP